MNLTLVWSGVMWGVVAISPVGWAATPVTTVRVEPMDDGLNLILETDGRDRSTAQQDNRPQVFMTQRQDAWVADIANAQLAEGGFRQSNPARGIASVHVAELDDNSIRVVVMGNGAAPTGELLAHNDDALQFAIRTQGATPTQLPVPDLPPSLFPEPALQVEATSDAPVAQTVPPEIDGAIPAGRGRAIAPPVGDIAVATTNAASTPLNLGTSEVIARLVLRDAPVRDVLALLARAANLNLVYDDQPAALEVQPSAEPEPAISLDIENEPIQNVFNYVLLVAGLEANRRGSTIFVSDRLPGPVSNSMIRSLRMNQVPIGVALNFLVGMGAESAVSRERLVTSVNAIAVQLPEEIAENPSSTVTEAQTTTEERIETRRVDYQDTDPPLRGLLVLGDERTNMLTLVGDPRQIAIATSQLTQLDVRRRQVAINVRIVDVDLTELDEFGTSFTFGINDAFFDWGSDGLSADFSPRSNDGGGLRAVLEAQITNGNAKILTDPTLIVQEGQTATVALTEEVPTTTGESTLNPDGDLVTFEQDDPRAAGLTLVIEVTRVDDNGFVALSVAPTVTAPSGEQENPDGSITTLLSSRSLQSGQIRLRDNQGIILTGIIQDSDRTTVSKVPILGDIPLLGALFRRSERQNDRREVIVLLTPQILDDSEGATFHYSPSAEAQELLQQR